MHLITYSQFKNQVLALYHNFYETLIRKKYLGALLMRGLMDLSTENCEDNILFLLSSCLVLKFEDCGRSAEGAYTLFIPTGGDVSGNTGGLTAGG
jgi:hypothetical protein